ncbi:PNPOx family protein [Kitasatospora purpeofusca]|uniref:hypothetical protein n=1 Tax=Kitasatospora purpeofusca TaxID=67352 RepID=UPI00380FB3E7
MSTTARARARARGTEFQRFGNKTMEVFHRIGLPVGPMQRLKVKGRESGREYTNPVAPVTVGGRMYILQAFPGSDWVKNVRAAGAGVLVRGRKARRVGLVEVPPGGDRGDRVRRRGDVQPDLLRCDQQPAGDAQAPQRP